MPFHGHICHHARSGALGGCRPSLGGPPSASAARRTAASLPMATGTTGYDDGTVARASNPTQEPTMTCEPTSEASNEFDRAASAQRPV
jgi:hypothetical protein